MSRRDRGWHPKGYFHVIIRGNNRQNIFNSQQDIDEYFRILNFVNDKYPFEIYAYCIMTNHVHFLIRSRIVPLGKLMAPLNRRYSDYYRKKHNYFGQIYQNRFYSKEVSDRMGLLNVGAYIHRNPIETTKPMVTALEHYPYSSYPYYFQHKQNPYKFLQLALLPSLLPEGREKTAAEYAKYCLEYRN
ncbi:transposase [Sporosarcina sp. FSL K6-1508]|uniref:transposase n=1 Tax=Sporosarcina sp. FSL K6-1508 TaxID=2921553 RepID=UPI0030F86122